MPLSREDLNELDDQILDILLEGRATPTLLKNILEENGTDVSRQYVNRRLKRLTEHGYTKNLYNTGVYEIIEDPRK